jgi:cell division protein ZapB
MASPQQIEQLTERVERLLLRHEEMRRTNALLQEQLDATVSERDLLKSRLQAARARIDALLSRLPAAESGTQVTEEAR